MGRIVAVMVLGAALFLAVAWQLGLFESDHFKVSPSNGPPDVVVTAETDLGPDLFKADPWPAIKEASAVAVDPIVLYGVMNPIDIEEVSSLVPGKILFLGEQVDDAVVAAAGSGAFLTEPYYSQTVEAGGGQKFTKYYRRIYEGQTIKKGQMVALIEPGEALADVLIAAAKYDGAIAERNAAGAAEKEGLVRYERAKEQYRLKAINAEDLGAAQLTFLKLQGEHIAKAAGVKVAETEKNKADIKLKYHEIRPLLHFKQSAIKSVVRQTGATVKPGDPIVIVQNLEKLQAEALIEEQYYAYLKELERGLEAQGKKIRATVEPSVLEKPRHELPGHDRDVTSVAVSRNLKIVSGSEDKTVYVWEPNGTAPLEPRWEHEDAVRVVACTPAAEGKNVCVVGCADGSIYLRDLDARNEEPVKIPNNKAHGDNTAITALAFSRDGEYFATGASDGTIRIWNKDGSEKYPFDPVHGVKQAHEDAVTSLHFTPQSKLISAGRDKTLHVWKLKEKGACADGKAIHNRGGAVGQPGVSSDGKWMLFDQATTLKLLSVESRILKHTLNVPVNSTPFETLALFSPDDSLILTAGAPEGRLQLWRAPEGDHRGFEVRQFGTPQRQPVSCAAFSSQAGKGGKNSFAVSASGQKVYVWSIPTKDEVRDHRIKNVEMTLKTRTVDPATRNSRVGFEVANPDGRFEAGRPVTIVIE